jgi:hypothetical protein
LENETHYPLAYCQSLPPLCQYSKIEIKGAEDEMNLASFFYKEWWLDYLKGLSLEDVSEVLKDLMPELPFGPF